MAGAHADFTFNRDTHPNPNDRIAAWSDSFSQTVDVQFNKNEIEDFSASIRYEPLGKILLVERRYTSHTVIRSRDTIARTGRENLIFHYFLQGGIVGMVGAQRTDVVAGDCFMYDMRETMRINMRSGHFIGLIIPSRIFEEALGRSARLHGLVLRTGGPQAFFLGQMMIAIAEQARHLGVSSREKFGAALIRLLAASVEGLLEEQGNVRHEVPPMSLRAGMPTATFTRLQRHIDRNAADPAYNPGALATAFGLSRATLYRKFQSEGGVADAIRARRATLARQAMMRAERKPAPLAAIAQASGFSSIAAMRRAFHLLYGASPAGLQGHSIDAQAMPRSCSLVIGALFDDLVL